MDLKAMGTGAKAAVLAGGALIAGAAGYAVWSTNQAAAPVEVAANNQAEQVAASSAAVAANPDAAPVLAPVTPEPAVPPTEAASAAPVPAVPDAVHPKSQSVVPTFDIVRVDPDGQALVAGRAEPGSRVILRLDGSEISATTANAEGDFTVLFVLDPSVVPRLLTMGSILPGQSETIADAEVALAPTIAPAVVAAVAPDDEPVVAAPEVAQAAAPAETAVDTTSTAKAPAALLVTKDGVSVLQSGDQDGKIVSEIDLSIDTISYTPSGEVQLAGRGLAAAALRVYLDNAPLIDVMVGEDGRWASTMPAIAPGIYTLRVDALAEDGAVVARFETPFKRETKEALAAAAQSEDPAIASTGTTPASDPQVKPEQTALAASTPEPLAVPQAEASDVGLPTASADVAIAPEASQADVTEVAETVDPGPATPVSITVQPGFTLWGIASEQFGDGVLYVQVFEANKDKIRDPNLIYPGQVFVIPTASE